MSISSVIVPVLTGGASATVFTTGVGAVVVRALKRIAKEVVHDALSGVAKEDDLKAIASDVTEFKVKFAAETGGNSGGLRQAVNDLTKTVGEVQVDVAHLKGLTEGQAQGKAAA